ncbi:MAG: CARDB domain-containing protein [Minisyncoccota bacterium]
MDTSTRNTPAHTVTIYALAAVGFVTLIGAGMWLAVYSARFVPSVASRVGEAAVYLGSVFTSSNSKAPGLSVVPTATSTTIYFGDASSTPAKKVPVPHTVATSPTRTKTTAGTKTSGTYQIGTASSAPSLYGLPDFVVTINAIGYLATTSADSFVASSTVPAGSRPAVRFTIKNVGTNVAGAWRFSALIPTQTAYIYQSQLQQPLNPGDSIDYTLGFDQANRGANETVSVTANFDHAIAESNTNNNSASAQITILGN